MKINLRIVRSLIVGILLSSLCANACIWDSDTLEQEKEKSPDFARAILNGTNEKTDVTPLRARIKKLRDTPREDDPEWWNDLAGAHIRLGEAKQAAKLLEKVEERFPNNYGIHANLGTAYHLLGKYKEAEKEIARDLEINPDAHFGLEKYHLALLQYLIRDKKYQSRHVYVDECTTLFIAGPGYGEISEEAHRDFPGGVVEAEVFFKKSSAELDEDELRIALAAISALDPKPNYRMRWDLEEDPKLKAGVLYMASLNPKEPACIVMLGIVSWKNGDLNLAVAAFDKAIKMGSPQSKFLKMRVKEIRSEIKTTTKRK